MASKLGVRNEWNDRASSAQSEFGKGVVGLGACVRGQNFHSFQKKVPPEQKAVPAENGIHVFPTIFTLAAGFLLASRDKKVTYVTQRFFLAAKGGYTDCLRTWQYQGSPLLWQSRSPLQQGQFNEFTLPKWWAALRIYFPRLLLKSFFRIGAAKIDFRAKSILAAR